MTAAQLATCEGCRNGSCKACKAWKRRKARHDKHKAQHVAPQPEWVWENCGEPE